MNEQRNGYSDLFDLIGVLARRRFQIGERYFATLGLNHTEARLLTLLQERGGVATQDALSDSLSVDRSNAGRALKALEQRRYLTRSQDSRDGRTKLVQITTRGRDTAADIQRLRLEMAQVFFGDLTQEQASSIADLLRGSIRLDQPLALDGDPPGADGEDEARGEA